MTPQITLECKNKCNGGYIKCPGPHWSHPDMFRVPPGKWPVSDMNQNLSCDTSNHIRMQKQVLSRQLETKVKKARHSIFLVAFALNITSRIVRCIAYQMCY